MVHLVRLVHVVSQVFRGCLDQMVLQEIRETLASQEEKEPKGQQDTR